MIQANPFYLVRGLSRWGLPALPPPEPGFHPESVDGFDVAIAAISSANPNCEVVFCDVFDTLLQRDVAPAEAIHEMAARYLGDILRQRKLRHSVAELLAARKSVTAMLAAKSHEEGRHGEYRLADVLCELSSQLLPDDITASSKIAADCLAYELRQELRHTAVVPGAASFLARLKKHYRLVCLTDTPLDRDTVSRLLHEAGLSELIDAIHVSSELGVNKRSGTLFDFGLAAAGITASQAVHVGDNPLSDWVIPQSKGIASVLLQHRDVFVDHARFVQCREAAQTFGCPDYLQEDHQDDTGLTKACRLGRDHFSLAFALFALQVLHLEKAHCFDRIYFVARDGYLPWQAFQRLAAQLDDPWAMSALAKVEYLHLSRVSTLCPQDKEGLDDAFNYSTLVHGRSAIPSFFATLGLDLESYATLLQDEGFTAEDLASASLETIAKLRQRIFSTGSHLSRKLREDLDHKRDLLGAYLNGKGFFSAGKVLLVDAGWRYRIAHNLEVALGSHDDFPELHCALLGYTDELPSRKSIVHPGFLFDARRINPIENLLLRHREIIEAIASAPEGSCMGYAPVADGRATPILQLGDYENELRNEIQQGVLIGVEQFASLYDRYQLGPEFQLHATTQLLWPILDHTHPFHEVVAELALPDAAALSLSSTSTGDRNAGSFISELGQRIEVNLGLHGPTAPPTQPLEKLLGLVQKAMGSDKPIILWGMGLIGKLVYPHIADRVAHVLDADPALHGQRYGGHIISSPDVLTTNDWERHLVIFTALTRSRPSLLTQISAEVLFAGDWLA